MRRLAIVTAIVLVASNALALDLPTRKAGLWELKMIFEGRNLPPTVMKHCTDAATDKLMNATRRLPTPAQQDMKTSAHHHHRPGLLGDMITTRMRS